LINPRKVPETPGMGKPKGNPNRIKYQSYTGVWVNYTVKKTPKVVVLVDGA